ncbi:ABC-2 type transport system permease protein [Halobiforma haloterrestris]|uniref:ABC-2 type transport system permease protein n=1 Tax=Natronobacterium haloterrestre TaxID=148448 RepID=A0A1I1JCF4_NATHA|nr:ABC transporter permease subunit [Halobiforma haloterrestris]SFC43110.1 ABC-2 type transport system permease protein [Halobiforma haloterrestris]
MLETFYYETDRNVRGTLVFVALVSVYTAFIVALFPSIEAAGVDIDQVVEAYPEAVRQAMGVQSMSTIEGFLATQIYTFIWVLLMGLYFAYRSAGLVADDVERDRMDLLLSLPISRSRLVLEKFASVLVPIVALNVGVGAVIYAVGFAIGESIDLLDMTMVHLLSIPYLLACAGIGLVLSTAVDRADVAQRVAIGIVFALYLVETIAASTDGFEPLQYVSPTHYYDPTAILLEESYAYGDTLVLLAVTALLVVAAQFVFQRRDI